jgi:predicted metal-dependent HD superfamily phosphohydrolase
VDAETVENVANAIICHNHKSKPYNRDTMIGLDIDLLILAQSKDIFDEYERNISKEYSFVEENFFRKKRAEILQSFLDDRSRIFLTDYFYRKFEEQARANLANSIKKLKA